MNDAAEVVLALVAVSIYGTEAHPRHWAWRCGARTLAYVGMAWLAVWLLAPARVPTAPSWLNALFLVAWLLVILGHEAGYRRTTALTLVLSAPLGLGALMRWL